MVPDEIQLFQLSHGLGNKFTWKIFGSHGIPYTAVIHTWYILFSIKEVYELCHMRLWVKAITSVNSAEMSKRSNLIIRPESTHDAWRHSRFSLHPTRDTIMRLLNSLFFILTANAINRKPDRLSPVITDWPEQPHARRIYDYGLPSDDDEADIFGKWD